MTGPVPTVVRHELRVLWRSRTLRIGIALATTVGIGASWVPGLALGPELSAEQTLPFLVAPLELVIALLGLLIGVGAIVGPRTGGQLKLTLALPIERRSLVGGAFIARAVIVGTTALVGVGAAAVTLAIDHGSVPLVALAGFAALLALLGVSLTALSTGVSAASPTRGVTVAAVIGAFVLFEFFWGIVPAAAHYLVEGTMPTSMVPAWVVLLERLQPIAAFEVAVDSVMGQAETGVRLSASGAESAASDTATLSDRLTGDPPWYLAPWVSVGTVVAWGIAPLWIGMTRFRRSDL